MKMTSNKLLGIALAILFIAIEARAGFQIINVSSPIVDGKNVPLASLNMSFKGGFFLDGSNGNPHDGHRQAGENRLLGFTTYEVGGPLGWTSGSQVYLDLSSGFGNPANWTWHKYP